MKTVRTRKPIHPGIILEEHYIKALNLNLQEIADHLGIARNTLFMLRTGRANITAAMALSLASAFDTTPQFWLNLQQKYDLWIEQFENHHHSVGPLYKSGRAVPFQSRSPRRRKASSGSL
jgi:addiction module HigA family antidote